MSWSTIHNLGQWLEFNRDIEELRVSYDAAERLFRADLWLTAGRVHTAHAETLTKAVNQAFALRDKEFKRDGKKRRARGGLVAAARQLKEAWR